MTSVCLARHAMATRFEIVLHGENPAALRAAGEAALDEVERIEAQLSLYRPTSEIAHVNARAAREPVRVTPGLFALLRLAQQLSEETDGAFDISVAPLVRCWGFTDGGGRIPSPDELAAAREKVGMHFVRLNEADLTVQFARDGAMLDLGAIGKGYAVDRAVEVLRVAGITSALIHGGTSTIYGLGQPPDADHWNVTVDQPPPNRGSPSVALAIVPLRDESLSVSAVWGKCFEADGKIFGHVLDPRTGRPVSGALLAAVNLPSATETDALSTALLTLGSSGHERIAQLRPGMRTLLVVKPENDQGFRVETKGIVVREPVS